MQMTQWIRETWIVDNGRGHLPKHGAASFPYECSGPKTTVKGRVLDVISI